MASAIKHPASGLVEDRANRPISPFRFFRVFVRQPWPTLRAYHFDLMPSATAKSFAARTRHRPRPRRYRHRSHHRHPAPITRSRQFENAASNISIPFHILYPNSHVGFSPTLQRCSKSRHRTRTHNCHNRGRNSAVSVSPAPANNPSNEYSGHITWQCSCEILE